MMKEERMPSKTEEGDLLGPIRPWTSLICSLEEVVGGGKRNVPKTWCTLCE